MGRMDNFILRLEEKLDRMLQEIHGLHVRVSRIEERLESLEESYDARLSSLDKIKTDQFIYQYEIRDFQQKVQHLTDQVNELYRRQNKLIWLERLSEDFSHRMLWIFLMILTVMVLSYISEKIAQVLLGV